MIKEWELSNNKHSDVNETFSLSVQLTRVNFSKEKARLVRVNEQYEITTFQLAGSTWQKKWGHL